MKDRWPVSLKASGRCLAGPGGTGHSWTFRWSSPLKGGLKSSWEVARRPTHCMNPSLNEGGSGGRSTESGLMVVLGKGGSSVRAGASV